MKGYILGKMLVDGTYSQHKLKIRYDDKKNYQSIKLFLDPFVLKGQLVMDKERSNGKHKCVWTAVGGNSFKSLFNIIDVADLNIIDDIMVPIINEASWNEKNGLTFGWYLTEAPTILRIFDVLGFHYITQQNTGRNKERFYMDAKDKKLFTMYLVTHNIINSNLIDADVYRQIRTYADRISPPVPTPAIINSINTFGTKMTSVPITLASDSVNVTEAAEPLDDSQQIEVIEPLPKVLTELEVRQKE